MLHPFASLKVLYNDLGATQNIPLSDENEAFATNQTAFFDQQYPVTAVNGSDIILANVTYVKPVNTLISSTETEESEIIVWALVLYCILIVAFSLLAIGFVHRMRQEKAAANEKTGSILYDGLANPSGDTQM